MTYAIAVVKSKAVSAAADGPAMGGSLCVRPILGGRGQWPRLLFCGARMLLLVRYRQLWLETNCLKRVGHAFGLRAGSHWCGYDFGNLSLQHDMDDVSLTLNKALRFRCGVSAL